MNTRVSDASTPRLLTERGCPPSAVLIDYLARMTSGKDRGDVIRHLEECDHCRSAVKALQSALDNYYGK